MNPLTTSITRRHALATAALTAGGVALFGRSSAAIAQAPATQRGPDFDAAPAAPGKPGDDYTPVIMPNGWTLPFKIVDGVKVFHLVVEDVQHEFAPGLEAKCWGFNGSVHGPLIEAVEGDRVRFFVTNKLAAPTTVHWHGLIVPNGMDGVGGLSQKAIQPDETFVYEFPLRQHGTFMYHSHHDEMTQMAMGLTGMFVIHPRGVPKSDRPDRDFALLLHEWRIDVGTDRPNPNEMTDFNILSINARVFPGTAPLIAKLNDKVKIRFGNLGAMDHHPIHLHGVEFLVTEINAGEVPEAARHPGGTILVPVGSTQAIEFIANNPGDWAMHCHMTHHVMNQMGHKVPNTLGIADGDDKKVRDLLPMYMTMGQAGSADMGEMGMKQPPNSIPMVGGRGPHDYITMGGMFTIVKVRETLPNGYDSDIGWYENKPGEMAVLAANDVLQRNGIAADGGTAPKAPK
ncbi:MAG: multicopper oxidase protein [Phycisphaerales bacterium]|nr:multicopper oxidase protein [Phycisphaerales bacterium]